MWPALKRLSLGMLIITATSAALLVSDLAHRKASVPPTRRLAVTAEHAGAQGGPAPKAPPGRVYNLGLVYFAPEPGAEVCMRGLFDALRDGGFTEGDNLQVHRAHAQGEIANITPLLQNYDSQGLDLIVAMTTPCLTAACGTVKKTPVVFTYVYDPIAGGVGESFTNHHPNVTGIGSFPPVDDTVEMIRRLVPEVKTVGTLYNSSEANSRKVVEVARDAFRRREMSGGQSPTYWAPLLRLEGRAAELAGDSSGAVPAYRHYLALRSDPDPGARLYADSVRVALQRLQRRSRS